MARRKRYGLPKTDCPRCNAARDDVANAASAAYRGDIVQAANHIKSGAGNVKQAMTLKAGKIVAGFTNGKHR